MDEALRYNQQLQFCKQLHSLQTQLCEDTYLSDELLNSLYALGKFCKTPACALQQLAATYPEVSSGHCSARPANNSSTEDLKPQLSLLFAAVCYQAATFNQAASLA